MYFERFDVVSAWYLYLSHYHEGQFSKKYKRLCKIRTYFNPGMSVEYTNLSNNGREIYNNLCKEHARA